MRNPDRHADPANTIALHHNKQYKYGIVVTIWRPIVSHATANTTHIQPDAHVGFKISQMHSFYITNFASSNGQRARQQCAGTWQMQQPEVT